MAQKYAINKEFGPFAHLHAPIGRPLLAALRAFPAFRPLSRRGITVKPLSIPGESLVKAFLIEPAGCSETLPCLVYFHGGGFVMRAAPSHCEIMRRYAVLSHIKVLYVDYRLAPKHPYPAALYDCLADRPRKNRSRRRQRRRVPCRRPVPHGARPRYRSAAVPAAYLPRDRLPDAHSFDEKIHGYPDVERRTE